MNEVRCPNCMSQDLIFAPCGCVNCLFCFAYFVCETHEELLKEK